MLGVDFVCPDSTIDELCLQTEYLETASDISLYYGIRTYIKDRFFNVISDILYQYVSCKRRRCAQFVDFVIDVVFIFHLRAFNTGDNESNNTKSGIDII